MAQTILEEKKKSRLMTEGSIWKSILLFSVPLILGNMLQQLYNTADSIIVGNFVGSNALAAVGSSGSPIFLLIGFSQGIAVGAGVVVSQFLGAKDREGAHTAVHTSLALSAILGAILTVCGIAVSRALLTAMNTPAEVLEDAVQDTLSRTTDAFRKGDLHLASKVEPLEAVVNELAESEDAHKVNAFSVESNIHGLIDTLDMYDKEGSPAPAEPASFEDRLKQFMQESDSRMAGNRLYNDRSRGRRRGGGNGRG